MLDHWDSIRKTACCAWTHSKRQGLIIFSTIVERSCVGGNRFRNSIRRTAESKWKDASRREMDEYFARKVRFALTKDRSIDKLVTAFSESKERPTEEMSIFGTVVEVISFKRAINVNISTYEALEDLRFIIAKAINCTAGQARV